ncbi:hypothetical protein EDF62_3400 [Leucobacter luti]|uniref:Uncharacterized protein n=1 Tax=Leucobacter luti TaxID=340320 RepID=A0A4R6RSQ4_9MICO|nr:hypothetical protein EDF62_3400 [Leucobacter luti]
MQVSAHSVIGSRCDHFAVSSLGGVIDSQCHRFIAPQDCRLLGLNT